MPSPGLRASALRARARLPPLYWVPGSAAPQRLGVWGSLLPSALFSLPALNHSHQHEGALSTSHPRKKRPVCAAVPCWSLLSNLLSQNIYGNNGTLRKIGHLLLEGVQLRTKRTQMMRVWRRFILSEGKSHPVFTASHGGNGLGNGLSFWFIAIWLWRWWVLEYLFHEYMWDPYTISYNLSFSFFSCLLNFPDEIWILNEIRK